MRRARSPLGGPSPAAPPPRAAAEGEGGPRWRGWRGGGLTSRASEWGGFSPRGTPTGAGSPLAGLRGGRGSPLAGLRRGVSHPAGLRGGRGLTSRRLTRQGLDARRRALCPGTSAWRPHLGQGCGLRFPRSGGRGGGGGVSFHFVLSKPRGPTIVFRSLAVALHLISAFRRCRQTGP